MTFTWFCLDCRRPLYCEMPGHSIRPQEDILWKHSTENGAEEARLRALAQYHLMDTPPNEAFDRPDDSGRATV